MRLMLLLATALLVHLAGGVSSARIPKACHKCRAMCGDSVSECVDVSATSCPSTPRGKASKCMRKTKRQCRKEINTCCMDSCKQTGSPVCCGGPSATPTTEPSVGGGSPPTTTEPAGSPTTTTEPSGDGGGPTTTALTTATTTTTTVCRPGGTKGLGGTRVVCATTTTTTLNLCFTDGGDGTITIPARSLQWEKKDGTVKTQCRIDGSCPPGVPNLGDLHDVNNTYVWSGCCGSRSFSPRTSSPVLSAERSGCCHVYGASRSRTGCETATTGVR